MCIITLLTFLFPLILNASTENIKQTVIDSAQKAGVDQSLALYVAEHESGFNPQALGDMNTFKKGKPVRARGIWQITEYYHPEISDSQAFDIEYSTTWAMKYLKDRKTCVNMWTTCRIYYNNQPPLLALK